MTTSLSKADSRVAHLTVRLDDPVSGTVLGTATVPGTGNKYRYAPVTAAPAKARGRHDVYLVFDGPANDAVNARSASRSPRRPAG